MSEEIKKAREILGEEKIRCLKTLFEELTGQPPQIDRLTYRVKHKADIDLLDQLDNSSQLIKKDRECINYRLSPYALPLIQEKHSEILIKNMNSIYEEFKGIYDNKLDAPISYSELSEIFDIPDDDLKEALFYMSEAHDVWSGLGNNFPFDESATIVISESVLRRVDFNDILKDYLRWNFINPQKNLSNENLSELFEYGTSSGKGFFSNNINSEFPDWFNELGETEKSLIVEIDLGMKNGQRALPLMGARALLENIMVSYVGDKGTFKNKLDKFCEDGFITKKMSEVLYQVIDAGSAVMHRSYIPSDENVRTCMDLIINHLQSLNILKPKIDELHDNLPKRGK